MPCSVTDSQGKTAICPGKEVVVIPAYLGCRFLKCGDLHVGDFRGRHRQKSLLNHARPLKFLRLAGILRLQLAV